MEKDIIKSFHAALLGAEQFGLFTYDITGNTVWITGYPVDAVGAVVIPSEIEGLPVGWTAGCP